MKRVKSACILQTLVFAQKNDLGLCHDAILEQNRDELARYRKTMERTHTRYQLLDEAEEADGSILVHVRKQYNDKTDVSEYFS